MARRLGQWYSLGTSPQELHLDFVIPTGQNFRWRKLQNGVYKGVIGSRVVELKQTPDGARYRTVFRARRLKAKDDEHVVHDYFNLHIPLVPLYEIWSERDSRFKALKPYFPGARVLRQDPLECLFQFICSSNNNIPRIQGMIERLCAQYGDLLSDVSDSAAVPSAGKRKKSDENAQNTTGVMQEKTAFYSFPTLQQLSLATEEDLKSLGFGYRAKFVTGSVSALQHKPNGGEKWLMDLRKVPYTQASKELCSLPGVGPKVAACVCLFSLDKHEAVPVDTHVWQLATRHYVQEFQGRNLTNKLMEEVETMFIERFGDHAGWALSALFIPELAGFAHILPQDLRPPQKNNRKRKQKQTSKTGPQDQGLKPSSRK